MKRKGHVTVHGAPLPSAKDLEEQAWQEEKARRAEENKALFREALLKHLPHCVKAMPHRYAYGENQIESAVERIMSNLKSINAPASSPAVYLAAYDLEIDLTKPALMDFLAGGSKRFDETKLK